MAAKQKKKLNNMKQDKSLKSTKQTIESITQLNAVITSKEFCKEQNLPQQSFENYTRRNSTPSSHMKFVPREARRAEGPPSVARFINLSRGDRARIAKGGQISICPYIFRWCPHSCLATKPNRDR